MKVMGKKAFQCIMGTNGLVFLIQAVPVVSEWNIDFATVTNFRKIRQTVKNLLSSAVKEKQRY